MSAGKTRVEVDINTTKVETRQANVLVLLLVLLVLVCEECRECSILEVILNKQIATTTSSDDDSVEVLCDTSFTFVRRVP